MCILLSGAGFVLPYNSFIATVDYFHTSFPGTTIVFDISLVYPSPPSWDLSLYLGLAILCGFIMFDTQAGITVICSERTSAR
jgi:hypothetical protein